jgi:hypothetical protein
MALMDIASKLIAELRRKLEEEYRVSASRLEGEARKVVTEYRRRVDQVLSELSSKLRR